MSSEADRPLIVLAQMQYQRGDLAAAAMSYQEILRNDPGNADAAHQLGLIAHRTGQLDTAESFIRRAIQLEPRWVAAYCNLGNVLKDQAKLDEAMTAYRQALAILPTHPESHNNLGNALLAAGRVDEAIAAYRRAIACRPMYAHALNNLAVALVSRGRTAEAIATYRRVLTIHPNDVEALGNLGVALHTAAQYDGAIAAYQQAIVLQPRRPEAYTNLGAALGATGRIAEAITAHRQAIALRPTFAESHHNLALALLLAGQFEEGWAEYEWRWKWDGFPSPRRQFSKPLWDGTPLGGRILLIHAEQGIGDTIQFARYLPLLAAAGGRILFECAPDLARLIGCVQGMQGIHVTPRCGLEESALPRFDVHAPMMSLPHLLKLPRPMDVPNTPYVVVGDERRAEMLRQPTNTSRLRIGIAWAGSPNHSEDRRRSIPVAALEPLLRSEADFYSLQVPSPGPTEGIDPRLIDLAGGISDFLDTALLISQLDLVICVDTAVAHLAGAMGKPTWLLLAYAPDWRWGLQRDDTDWYAGMKLFRQSRPGDWEGVIVRLVGRIPPRTTGF